MKYYLKNIGHKRKYKRNKYYFEIIIYANIIKVIIILLSILLIIGSLTFRKIELNSSNHEVVLESNEYKQFNYRPHKQK